MREQRIILREVVIIMANLRRVRKIRKSMPTIEGAGVHLKRAFGFRHVPEFDPFLLFDEFHSEKPEEYIMGFPRHPHRGVETITYVLQGEIRHEDSLGNRGVIRPGEVQWMTAGSGIIHQEMPQGDESGNLWGFQLWANLPSSHKMMEPRYQGVKSSRIPELLMEKGLKVRIICGEVNGVEGPVKGNSYRPRIPGYYSPGRGEVFPYNSSGPYCFCICYRGKRLF